MCITLIISIARPDPKRPYYEIISDIFETEEDAKTYEEDVYLTVLEESNFIDEITQYKKSAYVNIIFPSGPEKIMLPVSGKNAIRIVNDSRQFKLYYYEDRYMSNPPVEVRRKYCMCKDRSETEVVCEKSLRDNLRRLVNDEVEGRDIKERCITLKDINDILISYLSRQIMINDYGYTRYFNGCYVNIKKELQKNNTCDNCAAEFKDCSCE